jgi:hypothetical protein
VDSLGSVVCVSQITDAVASLKSDVETALGSVGQITGVVTAVAGDVNIVRLFASLL